MEGKRLSRKPVLPYDIRQECLWIVRGYDRRVKAYLEARRQVMEGTACGFVDTTATDSEPSVRAYLPHGNGSGRPAENKYEQLAAIEEWPETQRMRAVEVAKVHIGEGINNKELRKQLAEGILLNCMSRRRFPFSTMNLPGISETGFKNEKTNFLFDMAIYLNLIKL